MNLIHEESDKLDRRIIRKVVVDVTTLKMARKPLKLQKENPAGYAGEGKQRKGN